jgi:hypothetical protein
VIWSPWKHMHWKAQLRLPKQAPILMKLLCKHMKREPLRFYNLDTVLVDNKCPACVICPAIEGL